ncbi:MAG: hypothetical protein ACSLFI_13365 [Solirubrobacterales bacterium]
MFYSLIGKVTVKVFVSFFRQKFVFRTALLTGAAAAVGITVVGVAGYLATRDVPEG